MQIMDFQWKTIQIELNEIGNWGKFSSEIGSEKEYHWRIGIFNWLDQWNWMESNVHTYTLTLSHSRFHISSIKTIRIPFSM